LRQSRNVGALHETQRHVDEEQSRDAELSKGPPDHGLRTPRNYDALRDSHYHVDDRASGRSPQDASEPQRNWTHHGGMVSQQSSAMEWIRQNDEYGLSGWEQRKPAREGKEMSSQQADQAQKDQELAEARAAVDEARRQEVAERTQQQQRDRGGPER
jgi:hypothetical protein